MTTSNLTPSDRQLLTESYQRAKERHERRNELLMDLEGCSIVMWQGRWVFDFEVPYANDRRELSATDLRIIADELDRRNQCST